MHAVRTVAGRRHKHRYDQWHSKPGLPPQKKNVVHMQDRTALADTAGSRFTAECEALLAGQRHGDYLDRLLAQVDLIFAKAQDKGG